MAIWEGWGSNSSPLKYFQNIRDRGLFSDRDLSLLAGRTASAVGQGLRSERSALADRGMMGGGWDPFLAMGGVGFTPSLAGYGAGAAQYNQGQWMNRQAAYGAGQEMSRIAQMLAELETRPTQPTQEPAWMEGIASALMSIFRNPSLYTL